MSAAPLGLTTVIRRAVLLRCTEAAGGECRTAWPQGDLDLQDEKLTGCRTLLELAWLVAHGRKLVPGVEPVPSCGTPHCLMHLAITEPEQQEIQLMGEYRPPMSMAEVFRLGRRAGVFATASTYQ